MNNMNDQPQEAILVEIRVGNEIKTLEVTDSPSKIQKLREKAEKMQEESGPTYHQAMIPMKKDEPINYC